VVRGQGGEMTQALYAHMNNKRKKNLRYSKSLPMWKSLNCGYFIAIGIVIKNYNTGNSCKGRTVS
jgi:hypothetical protein